MGEVAVESDDYENPIHATTQEDINPLPVDGYEADDDIITAPNNKPRHTCKTDLPVYQEGWEWNDIDHRRASIC